jgi:hypothetical protein
MTRWIFQLCLAVACFPFCCVAEPSLKLGGGEPGLKILYMETNRFLIYLDEPSTVGPGFDGGANTRHLEAICGKNYGLKQLVSGRWTKDGPQQLYPFDLETAFTCEGDSKPPDGQKYTLDRVGEYISADGKLSYFPRETRAYSTNTDNLLVSDDVYALARSRYGLANNQLFLGSIGTDVFYFESTDPKKVFFRTTVETNVLSYFAFPRGVTDIYGVTKAVKKSKDVGFVVLRKPPIFGYSPMTFDFVEFSFKKAKRVYGNN